jgi:ribosomal protein S18 acetylase RimI-like enzyme
VVGRAVTTLLPAGVTFRPPTTADHAPLVARIDDWWGGRRMRARLPHAWFEHFSGTSWIAEDADGRALGFCIAYLSQDQPSIGVIHLVGVDPNLRRRGLGRSLVDQAATGLAARGATSVTAQVWPGDPIAIAFHRGIGFRVDDGPGTSNVYGTPGYLDFDGEGEDRSIFWRAIS